MKVGWSPVNGRELLGGDERGLGGAAQGDFVQSIETGDDDGAGGAEGLECGGQFFLQR